MDNRDPSPRKTIPLATGDERPQNSVSRTGSSHTKRVFFCGVVVENSGYGRELPPDVQELVASLGEPMDFESDASILSATSDPLTHLSQPGDGPHGRKRAMTETSALKNVIDEFVSTEQSYVKRLRILKTDYADPLRTFSRTKSTAIIPPYEAKTLFGNIDQILPVNEFFLEDLERMIQPDGPQAVGGIGDVVLKHFKEFRGFENYKQYYSKREEAQAIFEKEMRRAGGFAAFIDRIKYSSSDTKNRIGLRELLMDPVQRIPRYTLMFRTMIKFMAPHDPQRAKLLEADDIASKIAQAETDEQTKRAAIMYCLGATVEDFPPALISHSRRFIDCIDVEDVIDTTLPSSGSGPGQTLGNLHCTLFLFDDKLMIVKRPGNGEKGGKVLSGLSDLDKLSKSGGLPMGLKKSGMVCKGVVDVTDVVITDVGGADLHIYLETPPQDQGERWSGRPFRALSVVNPPAPINLDPSRTEADKTRFLENVWSVQAHFRTRLNQSVLLRTDDREVESRGARVTIARTYFNVYQRTAFMKETKKTKIVLHIDHEGSADPIPFGVRNPPFVVVRVQPMAGELSRYTVTSSDPNDEAEEDIVQTGRVPERVVQTIQQFDSLGPSRSPSVERGHADGSGSEWEEEETYDMRATATMDESERDLVARLELARRNSRTQTETRYTRAPVEVEDTIYEEVPPQPLRPSSRPASRASRASRDLPEIPDGQSQRSTAPRPTTPSNNYFSSDPESSPRRARSTSRHSAERHPRGPRTPSPLPPAMLTLDTKLPLGFDDDEAHDEDSPRRGATPSPLPRSKRQPFEPMDNTEATPKPTSSVVPAETPLAMVEPLSIKKKASVRTNESPSHRRTYQVQRCSPLLKSTNRLFASEKRTAASKQSRIPVPSSSHATSVMNNTKDLEELDRLLTTYETTKTDLESAHRAVKRIKLEVEQVRNSASSSSPGSGISRPSSPMKGMRTAALNSPQGGPTREAQARMEEMQRLIGKRLGEGTPRTRPLSMVTSVSLSRLSDDASSSNSSNHDVTMQTVEELAIQAEADIVKAARGQSQLLTGVKTMTDHLKEVRVNKSTELEKMRVELQGARRQTEVVKSLLADCTAEKEIMYEAFNEELDGMFNDANLPIDEAWTAMTQDLRQTKEAKHVLSKENSNMKRKLVEMEMQNEEWGALLRVHGLIP
ncbi:hypothetical protein EUX98_g5772 [Antrodiella citrinella]|uniref:DH domain-containing protein n=1 Tax=Antrodiella citrinella TaxID=2447956 RepID=A0A4S4MQY5_9APHY|nr:hypothetical protein EUX98_g5772 [Antrodiella citrinella]